MTDIKARLAIHGSQAATNLAAVEKTLQPKPGELFVECAQSTVKGGKKRAMCDTEAASGLSPAKRIRHATPGDNESSVASPTEPSTGPPLVKAQFKGEVYNMERLNAILILSSTPEAELQVQITMPDSEQWPFITFRCNPKKAMRFLTESDRVILPDLPDLV
ncbi:hypothetical protein CLIM01_14868 [Colletotrichum limetticola]|uniref:Uncharacterized protein n=1 Tax=Colletotrichum limetticola TaxID=1209924 RepID=A0ABQ9P9C0_9PEZI|nr:hypothetical protein CLIM01_14868 [Colletotrichum limetticola]